MSDKPTTITLQPWMKWVLGILIGYLPLLLTGYLAFHDLQRDFVTEQAKSVGLTSRVVILEAVKHERDLKISAMQGDLEHISKTMDRVEKTLLGLATE